MAPFPLWSSPVPISVKPKPIIYNVSGTLWCHFTYTSPLGDTKTIEIQLGNWVIPYYCNLKGIVLNNLKKTYNNLFRL